MHEKVLPPNSRALLAKLARTSSATMQGWTLAGGTGLALRLGHRRSLDFDFFRTAGMDIDALHADLKAADTYETLQEGDNTLTVLIRGVKLSFFQVRDPFVFDTEPYRFFSVADSRDIALMKLAAIASRGSKKDFVDLYAVLRSGPMLQDYFDLLPKKYGKERVNTYHTLKSMTYFDDAEEEPLPQMLEPFSWEECKAFLVREAHSIVLA